MKTTIRNLATAAALISAVSLVTPAGASAVSGEDGPSLAGQHFKEVAKELGLSAQQRQDIRAILKNNLDQVLPLVQQLKSEHRGLRSLIQANTVDEAAIRAQSAKVAAIQANLAVQRAQISQELRKLLTPEQILKFREIQAKRDQRLDKAGARILNWIEQD